MVTKTTSDVITWRWLFEDTHIRISGSCGPLSCTFAYRRIPDIQVPWPAKERWCDVDPGKMEPGHQAGSRGPDGGPRYHWARAAEKGSHLPPNSCGGGAVVFLPQLSRPQDIQPLGDGRWRTVMEGDNPDVIFSLNKVTKLYVSRSAAGVPEHVAW